MTTTRIRPCGEAALLLDCSDLADAVAWARRLEQLGPDAVDVVAAARSVLVTARDAAALPALRRRIEQLPRQPADRPADRPADHPAGSGGGAPEFEGAPGAREVTIDVRYNGPDLAAVAELAGVSPEALVRQHTGITWRAAFGGFAPGFCYLVDERELEPGMGGNVASGPLPTIPRLASPRPRVPAGSVGLADRFCAVYPGASPGGWQLIGTTSAQLWDLDRPDPALLTPGDTVRFRDLATRDRGASDTQAGNAQDGDARP